MHLGPISFQCYLLISGKECVKIVLLIVGGKRDLEGLDHNNNPKRQLLAQHRTLLEDANASWFYKACWISMHKWP